MRLNDFESLVQVLLHGLVIDQVLLELLCELGAENLQVFSLLRRLLIDLDDFFVDVATEEVGPLSRLVLSILNLLEDLAD